ncbi:N-acetylgalactosamine 6-sulfate sulfatase (GALNS) [Blastopirellula marina DSM 3645]|uniref:N-acetylgalactosamine 6-sulfate sulfatase (GALNS) n=1 Tax=Blastopirellula marina DSM 3645 TaxID=314230 RepID=A3ZPD4_9BACT|nr:N-acetylgalactosamine 6-sulfate sulfatase (GALNS) [Blastopirellula marina DSM 3645]
MSVFVQKEIGAKRVRSQTAPFQTTSIAVCPNDQTYHHVAAASRAVRRSDRADSWRYFGQFRVVPNAIIAGDVLNEVVVVRWPDHIRPGTASDVSVIGSDIFATLLDVTGTPPPADR